MTLAATELAQIAAAGGQLGVPIEKLETFVRLSAQMSTAFGMSAEEAGQAVAKLSNVFNLPIEAVRDLGKFDVLARPGFMKARVVAQAAKWTRPQPVRARLAIMRAHENAVTVSLDAATLLELALAEALA